MCRIRPNDVWALVFQFDALVAGRTIKMLSVINEFTREALAIEVDHSIEVDCVSGVLDQLMLDRSGPSAFLRMNGETELVAHAPTGGRRFNDTVNMSTDPGSPWVNAWIELFRGRLRDKPLYEWCFESLLEARAIMASKDRRVATHSVSQHWLPRFFLLPFNIGFHLAHHVDAGVPFRYLPRYHQLLVGSGYVNPVYEYGTYTAIWKSLTLPQDQRGKPNLGIKAVRHLKISK
jgi:hypothetical protein